MGNNSSACNDNNNEDVNSPQSWNKRGVIRKYCARFRRKTGAKRQRRWIHHQSQLTAVDYIILEEFQLHLRSLGFTDDFVQGIRQSNDPREAMFRYLDEFRRALETTDSANAQSSSSSSALSSNITGPPPASRHIFNKLHTVAAIETAAASDDIKKMQTSTSAEIPLEEPCNICCENFHGEEVMEKAPVVKQLPCGHCFHETCIHSWLTDHCTCPVCRYELPTDDALYEVGRMKRMRSRKIITSYEDESLFFCSPCSSSSEASPTNEVVEGRKEVSRRSSWGVMDIVGDIVPRHS